MKTCLKDLITVYTLLSLLIRLCKDVIRLALNNFLNHTPIDTILHKKYI